MKVCNGPDLLRLFLRQRPVSLCHKPTLLLALGCHWGHCVAIQQPNAVHSRETIATRGAMELGKYHALN
jgi:peptide methionine sulfoxide reductase MsrA